MRGEFLACREAKQGHIHMLVLMQHAAQDAFFRQHKLLLQVGKKCIVHGILFLVSQRSTVTGPTVRVWRRHHGTPDAYDFSLTKNGSLEMSLKMIIAANSTIQTKATWKMRSLISMGRSRRKAPSISSRKIMPPSRMGKGSRLKTARLMEIMATVPISGVQPGAWAA